jgi:hypothetical protein
MSEHNLKDVEHIIRSCRASDHLQYPERRTVVTAFTLDPRTVQEGSHFGFSSSFHESSRGRRVKARPIQSSEVSLCHSLETVSTKRVSMLT